MKVGVWNLMEGIKDKKREAITMPPMFNILNFLFTSLSSYFHTISQALAFPFEITSRLFELV
jgi:hypothetical protein